MHRTATTTTQCEWLKNANRFYGMNLGISTVRRRGMSFMLQDLQAINHYSLAELVWSYRTPTYYLLS